jgi:EmrB/QacA subfamily drug resistance transporter
MLDQHTDHGREPNHKPANGDTGPARSSRRWWILGVMSLATLMVFLDNTIVNTAIPSISRDLEASISELQWVIDAYTLVLAGLLLIGGSIGDRYGRRRWMTIGLVIFGVGSLGAALSGDITTLIVMRGVQGAGAALILPATLSIITANFERDERAKAIGIWSGVGALGIGLGPALGGYFVDTFGWASVFFMHLPIIAVILAGMRIVPESVDKRARKLDVPGAVLGSLGLTALVYGLIRAGEVGWTAGVPVLAFGAAVLLLAAFIIVELRTKEPMLPLQFFREKDFTGAVVVIGLIMFGMMVSFFFLTQFFQIVQGRSAFQAGLLIIPTAVTMMIAAPISGMLVKRVGPRWLVLGSAVAMTTGLLLLTQATVGASTFSIVGPLMLFGLGGGLGLAPLTDTVMAAVPVADAGIGSAVNDVSRELGAALGIATVGSFVNSMYRSSFGSATEGVFPPEAAEAAGEGIGVAHVVAERLGDAGPALVEVADAAFLDAMTFGFAIGAAFVALAGVIAVTLIPTKMREVQVEVDDVSEVGQRDTGAKGVSPQPAPAPA